MGDPVFVVDPWPSARGAKGHSLASSSARHSASQLACRISQEPGHHVAVDLGRNLEIALAQDALDGKGGTPTGSK